MIEWFLDWCARAEDRRDRSLLDRLISGSGKEDESSGTLRGRAERSTDEREDEDE